MSNSIMCDGPAAASDAAIAEPTPPAPTTSTRKPATALPLRSTPRTKPAPSNMSASSDPSGRFSTALAEPAICAVGVTSSTISSTAILCGMVISAPCIVVIRNSSGNKRTKSSDRTPSGTTTASSPCASNHGL